MAKQVSNLISHVVISAVAGMAGVIGITWLLEQQALSAPLRLGLIVIPVALFAYAVVSYCRLVRQADELQRHIHLEALALAFPASIVAVFLCEYLRKADFIAQFKPDYALMMMLLLWGLGYVLAWRRYQ